MKFRIILPAVAVSVLSLLAANPAEAGLFGRGCGAADYGCGCATASCCEPVCGSPCGGYNLGGCCGRRHGLLHHLKHLGRRGCCGGCQSSCGCEPTCGAIAPSCGCAAPTCGMAAPTCGIAEPTCGVVEPSCGCNPCGNTCGKPRCGLFARLHAKLAAKRACCATSCCAAQVSCGCEPTCGM